jgi:hypothetical protein
MSSSNFAKVMVEVSDVIADLVVKRAKELAPTERIRESIHTESIILSGEKTDIRIVATAREAAAYEYGSGIHARRARTSPKQLGPRGKIVIAPKNKKYLAFPWDKASPAFPTFEGKTVIKRWWQPLAERDRTVLHPGVEARPPGGYMATALKEKRKEMRSIVSKSSRNAIVNDIRGLIRKGKA